MIDIIVISAVSDLFHSQAHEFFLFAGLMFLDMFCLMLLARRYTYVDYTSGRPYDFDDDDDDYLEKRKRLAKEEEKRRRLEEVEERRDSD